MKPRILYKKGLNRLYVEKNRLWKYCNLDSVPMLGYMDSANAVAFKNRLNILLGNFDASILEHISSPDRDIILFSAGQALEHEFDLLGSGLVRLDPIDWQVDFKSGARWNKVFYKEMTAPKGADIKVPWELSRCQHLLWLGEAYLLTSDDKYAKEVVDEICWWIDDNPLMYSVNWTCAMDVAFRAVNWMFALNMIASYPGFDYAFSLRVEKSLWQHGFFIRNNLERQIPYSNNHYASDVVGLLYLGALFRHTSKGKKWLIFALKEYNHEVLTQILPSGVHYERSISYHRMMTELFSYPVYMLRRIGQDLPNEILERIGKMYDYVATYTKPNGLAPLIADNDDGRFVPFMKRDFRRHDYLNNANSIENKFICPDGSPLFCSSVNGSHIYTDAGVAVIKQGNDYLLVNLGGYSKYPKESDSLIGTHTHNDLLSFELSLDGEDILVDAGTYLYTSSKEDRNAFRATSKHNTVLVDGEEQNGMLGSFALKRNIHKGVLKQIRDYTVEGEYTTIEGKMNHRRRFDFNDGKLVITDTISKADPEHEARLLFHFTPGLSPSVVDEGILVNDNVLISFNIIPTHSEIIDDTVSPSYGVLAKSKTAFAVFGFDNELTVLTTIQKK